MNKIESIKYIRPISSSITLYNSIGDSLPIEITWECNGSMYNRKQEKGGLCAILSEHDNVIGVVENPYTGGYNSAYVLNATNQIIWNVSELFMSNYGSKYYGGVNIHFVDVRIENGNLYFFINISDCDFRFSINVKTGEIGQLIETR
ncbi:hypothetical protein [Bacteroides acidifaciens]|uniref:hypothetical protein n=1 Tax=Bacteroides acidifaciens TaxID=85831 RepID=UPI0025A9ED96|nr:hypothetical protein [Bacteroides acidifaciens]